MMPSVRSATEWYRPTASAVMLVSPDTCTGVSRWVVVPSPSWPSLLPPQAQTVPSVRSATECFSLALTVGVGHALAERVKVLETEALSLLVIVTVTETLEPAGTQEGEVQTTSLEVSVLEGGLKVPREAVHEKLSGEDASS